MPLPWNASGSPALPEPFGGARATTAKRSPPSPQRPGMTTVPTSAAATAASTALPPLAITRRPVEDTSGCCEAIMPPVASVGLMRRRPQAFSSGLSDEEKNPSVIIYLHVPSDVIAAIIADGWNRIAYANRCMGERPWQRLVPGRDCCESEVLGRR